MRMDTKPENGREFNIAKRKYSIDLTTRDHQHLASSDPLFSFANLPHNFRDPDIIEFE